MTEVKTKTEKPVDATISVSDAAERAEKQLTKENITLSTGVVLKIKKAPIGIFLKVSAADDRPEVYKIWIEEEKRYLEHPDHPDYIRAVKAYESKMYDHLLNAILLLCTELERIPQGMEGPDGKEWLDYFNTLDMETRPESKGWRYLNWLILKAIITEEDWTLIMEVAELSGLAISKDAVQRAANFPGSD